MVKEANMSQDEFLSPMVILHLRDDGMLYDEMANVCSIIEDTALMTWKIECIIMNSD